MKVTNFRRRVWAIAADVEAFLNAFEAMVPAVTAFFDNVLVHTDDVRRCATIALRYCR